MVYDRRDGIQYRALVGSDTFTIAGLEIPGQDFLEATEADAYMFIPWEEAFDGILGLGLDDKSSVADLKGVFTNMAEKGVLDRNIISILIGRDWTAEGLIPGRIEFGGINEDLILPNTTMTFLPVSNNTGPYLDGAWRVSAESVSFSWLNKTSGETENINAVLPEDSTARFDTLDRSLSLPSVIADKLWDIAKPTRRTWSGFYEVDCHRMDDMPDLEFVLGGHTFLISSDDYIMPVLSLGELRCVWEVYGNDLGLLFLGLPFMRGHYVALDRDERTVGLAVPSWRERLPRPCEPWPGCRH